MERVSSIDFDMVEDATAVVIRTADGKMTKVPVKYGSKLSVGTDQCTEGIVSSAGRGVLAWAGMGWGGGVSTSEPEILDVGCSTQEAAEFLVRYFEDPSRICVLSQSPLLLMNVLELAFAIRSEQLFMDGCLLLGEQLKQSTRAPIVEILEGSRGSSDLFQVFKGIVASVRERFCLPRSSLDEDALLAAEIRAGSADLTWSSVDCSTSDAQADVTQFEKNLKYIASFQPSIWQPNTECYWCPDCGASLRTYFGLPKIKGTISHCRVCGKGKCSSCVKFRVHESYATVERPPNEPPDRSTFRKVCSECFKRVTNSMKFSFLSNAFMLSGLGVLEVSILRFVCDVWRGAAELCLREYHNMLYVSKIRAEKSKALRKLVTSSAPFYRGHPQAIVFLARSFDWGSEVREREEVVSVIEDTIRGLLNPAFHVSQIPHLHLFCTRACSQMAPELCGYQLLEAFRDVPRSPDLSRFRRLAIDLILCGRSGEAFTQALIPLLMDAVSSGHASGQEALDCLLDLASKSPKWALLAYLEARSRNSRAGCLMDVMRLILSKSGDFREKMHCTGEFLELLDRVESTGGKERMINSFRGAAMQMNLAAGIANADSASYLPLRPMLYPFDPSVTIVGVMLSETAIKKFSNSRPTIYTLVADTKKVYRVLHKRECVRKDAVVSSIIAILHHVISQGHFLWPQTQDGQISLPNYGVIPISSSTGIIEIVEGVTLQNIYDDGQKTRLRSQSVEGSDNLQEPRSARAGQPCGDSAGFAAVGPDESPLLTKLLSLRNTDINEGPSFEQKVGRRFLASAKFFLVLNYLLAIGDRHRDNVVLTPEGYILHIDFGYILGSRPLPEEQLHALGAKSYVRFDGDLDMCVRHFQPRLHEGKRSPDPQKQIASDSDAIDAFLDQTAELFIALRPQTYAILILLQHLVNCGELSGNTSDLVAEKLRNITMGGSAQAEVKKEFIRRIRESMGAESLRDWVYTKAKSIKALLL